MPPYPQTVDGIVAELKARGERFQVLSGRIRSVSRIKPAGCFCCPMEVLTGRVWDQAIPAKVNDAVIDAADGLGDPAVRAQLLTLCQG